MFKNNKYTSIYYKIIDHARNNLPTGYYERHHIIPKCLGGSDEKDNLINLSARQHLICHRLLTKMSDINSLKYAYIMLVTAENEYQERYKVTSREYERVKIINSKLASEKFKNKQKHNVGKKKFYHIETNHEILAFIGEQPDGYILGFSPITRKKLFGRLVGNVYYYNPLTMHVISLKSGLKPPDGYIKGNPNASKGKESLIGRSNFKDPLTGKILRTHSCPEGYLKGYDKIWINNGVESKTFNKLEPIPLGWVIGRIMKTRIKKIRPEKIICTPFGEYRTYQEFCDLFDIKYSFFDELDIKMRVRRDKSKFIEKLKNVGYNFDITKRENGFYFKEIL